MCLQIVFVYAICGFRAVKEGLKKKHFLDLGPSSAVRSPKSEVVVVTVYGAPQRCMRLENKEEEEELEKDKSKQKNKVLEMKTQRETLKTEINQVNERINDEETKPKTDCEHQTSNC